MADPSQKAPVVRLSVIAPSLHSIPEEIAAESMRLPNGEGPLEVTFQDEHSIMTSRTISSLEADAKPKIPDGGWGWMVVFACLMVSLIQDGISFSFGVLFDELSNEFKASASSTSWIGSLFISVPLITGPVMSALVDKYGCRKMTILGGFVSGVGFVLSCFARSIGMMYVTFGIIAGLGLGLTFITAVVSIAFWFEKKRNLAVGLGACGIGIGTFVYAPLTAWLLEQFGWRGTILLLAGTLFNICICGALMRDPDWIIEQNKRNSKLSKSRSSKSSSLSINSSPSEKVTLDELKDLLKSSKDAEYILQTLATSVQKEAVSGTEEEGKQVADHHQSALNLPTFVKQNERFKKSTMDTKREAPLASLSTIVPSLDPTPDLLSLKEFPILEEGELSDDSITAPLEVRFLDQDSIMSSRAESTTALPSTLRPPIPDGGWGWMVVFSSLMLSMVQDGISFSFGILFIEFIEEFQASASSTSWIGSLFLSVPLLTGPIMSALVDKYGCRAMTIVGGLISTTGFLLSSCAPSIGIMYVTFGIVSGLGLGLTYITAVVSIAFWFDQKRNLAVGLGACGTGIGTFVYAPFTTYLLEEFGWRGTVVLLAGTLLNMCVCGALMRDPDWIEEQNKQQSKLSKSSRSSKTSSLSGLSDSSDRQHLEEVRTLLKSGKDAEYVLQTLATSLQPIEEEPQELGKVRNQSALNLPTFIREDIAVPVEVLEQLRENKKIYKIILENYPSLLLCRSTSEKGLNKLSEDVVQRIPVTLSLKLKKTEKPKPITHQYSLPENPLAVTEPLIVSPTEKKPKVVKGTPQTPPALPRTSSAPWLIRQFSGSANTNQNYFKNMRFPRHSLIHRGAVLNKNKYKLRASSCPNIYRVSMATLLKEEDELPWYTIAANTCKELFDFSLFLEFHFFLMSLSTIILFAWFMTPYFYLVDHMDVNGYSKTQASFVMSAIGISQTIGMVGLGWAGDQPWMNVSKTYAVCLVFCGIFCCATMLCINSYVLLTISSALYGLFLASSFSFTPIILVELLPLETFTKAYGLTLLCQGIGHLIGPPLAGLLNDYFKTWDFAFHLSGVWIIISGFLILIIPYTKNFKIMGEGPVEKELANENSKA